MREGRTRGVWDVFIPFPGGFEGIEGRNPREFCGAYIEFKAKGRTLTEEQRDFYGALLLARAPFAFRVFNDWLEAATWTCNYLGVTDPDIWHAIKMNTRAGTAA